MPVTEALSIAVEAAHAAAEIQRQRRPTSVSHKGAVDLVTEVDLACEEAVRAVLERRSPGVPVLGDEGGGAWGLDTRWLVDPLDGTTNFVHGFPSYGVSIALQEHGELVAACVVEPLRDEVFTAERGGGSKCNGEVLRVSTVDTLSNGLLLTGFPYDRREKAAEYLKFVQVFLENGRAIRRAGAAAIDFAWLAAGRGDGLWEFGLQPWDVAAGALLVQEAGGRVTDMDGGAIDIERPRVLATNGRIHDEMAALLKPLLSSHSL